MRRLRTTVARVILCACLLLCLGAAAVAAATSAGSRAQLNSFICQKALDPPARAISVTAEMRPITGTKHMQMEFNLLSSTTTPPAFTAIAGTGLGTWISPPNPNLGQRPGDIWVVHHPVADLTAPAVYRFSVGFRWLGATNQTLKTVTRTTKNCNQPEQRPDLFVQSFVASAIAGHPNVDLYTAVIGNQGGGPAKNFEVTFTDAAKIDTRTIPVMAKGATRTLEFSGPLCVSGAPPTLVLDPTNAVDDSNRANNTASATCPAPPPVTSGSTGPTGPTGSTGTGATGSTGTTGRHGGTGRTGKSGSTGQTG